MAIGPLLGLLKREMRWKWYCRHRKVRAIRGLKRLTRVGLLQSFRLQESRPGIYTSTADRAQRARKA
jgi:hypothetical protein